MTENKLNSFVMQTPFGKIECISNAHALLKINLNSALHINKPKTALEKDIQCQLASYFRGESSFFSIPLEIKAFASSDYQVRVCQALQRIPVGTTLTYGALASQMNSSARAVGGGCRRNPLPVIIPCHRVVAANGIGGFSGKTKGKLINAKQWLLQHEQELIRHGSR